MKDLFGNPITAAEQATGSRTGERKSVRAHRIMCQEYGTTEGRKCAGCNHLYFASGGVKNYPKCAASGLTGHTNSSDWSSRWPPAESTKQIHPTSKIKTMKIYIASSWKNQHGVEMLTALLRKKGHEVISWVENNYGEEHNHVTKKFSFEDWVNSDEADQSFEFDTRGATKSDLVIYYAPSGKDACAELGAAWAAKVPIIGLYAKGEDLGLMRKMALVWCSRYTELLEVVDGMQRLLITRVNLP